MRDSFALVLLLATCWTAVAPRFGDAQATEQCRKFAIDPTKPYVYLAVEQIGPRQPLRRDESGQGIWLRLVNNCRIPIVVVALKSFEEQSPKIIGLEDEVVINSLLPIGDTVQFGVTQIPGRDDFSDILLRPNTNEAISYAAEAEARDGDGHKPSQIYSGRPRGYNGINSPGHREITLILPGEELPFSVPADHVSSLWHLEIPFRFALPHVRSGWQPSSAVPLFWEDLPNAYRNGLT